MKAGLFPGMCHIFLISRGLQKNSLLTTFNLVLSCPNYKIFVKGFALKQRYKDVVCLTRGTP